MKVVVAGAGVIGCAVAYELAARGAEVVVLDPRSAGEGATRASAGVLAPYIEGHSQTFLTLGATGLAEYDQFIGRVRADSGLSVEYARTGTLQVALNDEQAELLRQIADRHRSSGVEHQYMDAKESRALEPSLADATTGGLFVPTHGYVAARELTAALVAAAERHGAVFRNGCAAERLSCVTTGVRISTTAEAIDADAVVLAAGSWSGQVHIEKAPAAPVKPIRGQLLQLACPAALASRVIWGTDCYLVPWQDGRLLVGATMEDVGFDEGATAAGVRDLLEAACELLPGVWKARFQEVRVGLRPASSDELPIIGRAAGCDRVCYATAHYRNGILLAPLTAMAVAELVLNGRERPELAFTKPSRFGL